MNAAHAVQDGEVPVATIAGAAAAGRTAFTAYGCWQCHGTVGQGGGAGPALPRDYSLEALTAKLRTHSGRMPVYSRRVLPDTDVANIAAYIHAFPPDPPVDRIPQL
jgi:mono/diheme cytochrome c family protein